MQHLQSCRLFGYKSIKDVYCEFNEGLNVVIGNNGSGKTNLLEFIYKVLKRDYNGLSVFKAEMVAIDGNVRNNWIVEGNIDESNKLGADGFSTTKIGDEPSIYVEFIGFDLPSEIPILSSEYNPKMNIGDRPFFINEGMGNMPASLFNALGRLFNSSHFKKISRGNLTDEFVYHSIQDVIQNSILQKGLSSEIFKFTPIEDIRLSNSVRVTQLDSSTLEFRNIIFEYKINNQWFPWDALSDGTKRLLYTIFTIHGVDIKLEDGSESKLIPIALIEEPELGIHPHQLHLFLSLLRERATKQQVILTTHSPQVLDALSENELSQIFISEIDFEKGTTIRKMTDVEMQKAKLYLKEEGMLSDYWRFSDFQRSKYAK